MPSQVSHTGTRGSLGHLSHYVRPAVLKRHLRGPCLHCSNPLEGFTRATGLQTSRRLWAPIPHLDHYPFPCWAHRALRGRRNAPPLAWAPWEAHLSIFIHRDLSWVQTPILYSDDSWCTRESRIPQHRCKQVFGQCQPQ